MEVEPRAIHYFYADFVDEVGQLSKEQYSFW
jgi:hypothetical protein